MKTENLYTNAHIFVAGIRVCENRDRTQPSIKDVCQLLDFSLEQGNFICKKLIDFGVIEMVEGAFGTRLFIKDHVKMEEIPNKEEASNLEEEVKKFQDSKKEFTQKIESIQAAQAEKKKNLFADVEKKFKEQIEKKQTPK